MDAKDAEIAELKARLEASAGPAAGVASDSRTEGVPAWLIIVAAMVFGGIAFAVWAQADGDRVNAQPMSERIAESCEREYGSRGEEAVNACRIRLSIDAVNRAEADRLRRARDGV